MRNDFVIAAVSLGSNIEPRNEYLVQALQAMSRLPSTRLIRASTIIETEPLEVPTEFATLKFLNQAALFGTALEVHEFSRLMHKIEDELGRVRGIKNGPRTIDIDLIDFGGIKLDEPELTLPHPRAYMRHFVVEPLKEIGFSLFTSAAKI